MSDKKHIDRLFQESFKDFEAIPSDAVWENIETKLNQKKKKRRVIPIWWRYAGVAALLLLLLTISFNYFGNNSEQHQINSVSDTENNIKDAPKQHHEKSSSFDGLNTTKKKALTDNNTSTNNLNGANEAIANVDSNENPLENKTENNKLNDEIDVSKEASIADNSASINLNESRTNSSSASNKKANLTHSILKTEDKTAIALNSNNEKNNETSVKGNEEQSLIDENKAKKTLNNLSEKNTGIAQNETVKEEEKLQVVAENKIKGSTLTIEDAIEKTKDTDDDDEKLNKWSITPNAAPVYFSTLGEGSSIDPQFNNNSKTGDLNMSYGISASYAVNKKVTIRSGINRVNLGYNTNNVIVFQSVGVSSSSALRNVDVSSNDGSVSDVLSNASTETLSVISGENFNNSLSFATNTSINQSLGYIEVPLEIQYTLSSKKFGVNVIGGFSSFFLNDNKIYSEAEGGGRIFLGKATNINDVSYSANFGLGLNYKVSKKIDLNLEPMFKYQINTFNNTSGDFQPFFIGVYSGFAIKF